MIGAVSRKFADVGLWNGQFVPERLQPSKQIVSFIGKMQCADPHANRPYNFDHLDSGFHDITFYDAETSKMLTLVFARTMGEKEPVAVLCESVREAQAQLKSSVLMSQMPGSGEEMAYDPYPALSTAAERKILEFVGADESHARVALG